MSATRFTFILLAGTALAGVLPMGTAFAQEAAEAATDSPEEIIVTSRFRDESLQNVPIAITALSGDKLVDRQLNTIQDLSASVPSIQFRGGSSSKDRTLFIRGIGTITTSIGVEPSVSTVLDGVVLTRPGQSTLDLNEVERVEVLRGPQGTLFGKNASAGVISIVTRDPTDDLRGYGEALATSDEEYRLKAGLSGAIVPGKVQALIGGLWTKWDGNVHNLFNGDKVNGYRRYGGRGKIVFLPTETLKFTLIGDYFNSRDTIPTGAYVSTSQIAYPSGAINNSAPLAAVLADMGIVPSSSNRSVSTNFNTDVRDRNFGISLTGQLELGDYQLTSITGWRKWLNRQHQDNDGISTRTSTFHQAEDLGTLNSRQFSQEIRLASPKQGLVDYVVGLYYLHADSDERYQRTIVQQAAGTGALTETTGVGHDGLTDNNFGVFGEANVNLSKRFRFILGYRSTWDDIDYYHVRVSTADPQNTGSSALDRPGIRAYHKSGGGTNQRGDSYKLGAQFDVSDHAQTYFTYLRGYKGPGYNVYFNMRSLNQTTPLDEIVLNPETSRSYEFGLKGSTADRSFTYSLSLYTTKFDNYQANFNDVVAGAQISRLINAGTVQAKGVEIDLSARPVRGFKVDFSLSHTDAKVDHFNCPVAAPTSCNIDGRPLPFAPRWKVYGNADYQFALTNLFDLDLQSDISLVSRMQYQLTQSPSTIQPSYAIWNASAGLINRPGNWQIRAFVKNIANTHYSSLLSNGSVAGIVRFVPRDDKRYAGLQFRTDF